LLAGDPIRAAIYLDAAMRGGGDNPALRYLLARAIAILDKQQLALIGPAGAVRDGTYSPDGAILVTAGEDRTARIWDAATGRELAALRGHNGRRIFSIDVDPTGARIVTAGDDRTARLWDARSGRPLATLAGHAMWVWVARFSPDGAHVVTASLDGTARLWDATTGRLIAVLHEGSQVSDALFSGSEVLLKGEGPTVSRWDAATGTARGRAANHAAPVTAIAAGAGGRFASASADGVVQVHGPGGTVVAVFAVEPAATRLAFSRDGRRLALAGGTELQVWDLALPRRLATMHGHAAEVTAIEVAPDGARIASSSEDGTVRLWDVATGQALALIPSLAPIQWLAFSHDGDRIAVGGAGGASVWSTRNDGLRAVLELGEPVASVALRGDGGQVIACGALGAVRVWPTRGGPAPVAMHTASRCAAAITPDGAIAITGDDDGQIQTWDTAAGRPLRELAPTAAPRIYAITISPDGRRAVTGHDDNDARIWDVATGRLLTTLTGHTQAIFATAWSPDGGRVATCSNDGTSKIWNATTGDAIRTVELDASCPGIAFDPAGEHIATASRHVAQVWTGAGPADAFEGHQGDITSVLFGPRGLLVTTSLDTTVRIWDLATHQALESIAFPRPVDEADVSADRSLLAVRSGERVYLWDLAPALSPARVRAIVDALPLALHDGALVRAQRPDATPADTARPSYRP
jgi:WD40 repeat protein